MKRLGCQQPARSQQRWAVPEKCLARCPAHQELQDSSSPSQGSTSPSSSRMEHIPLTLPSRSPCTHYPCWGLQSHNVVPLQPRGSQPGLKGRCYHRPGQDDDPKYPKGQSGPGWPRWERLHHVPLSFQSLPTRCLLSPWRLGSSPQVPGLPTSGEPAGPVVGWGKLSASGGLGQAKGDGWALRNLGQWPPRPRFGPQWVALTVW